MNIENMIVKEQFSGVDESNAIIKADVRDGKYTFNAEKYFEQKMAENQTPDFEEWYFEHHSRLEKLKDDLARFYEITHLPADTIEKIYQLAWDIEMVDMDEDDDEETRLEYLQGVVDRFGDLADLFKL